MGLFSKKAGGSFFGNILRGVAGIAQGASGVNLGIGAGAGKIEKGQRYTNKAIQDNPALYVTPGEKATNGEIDVDPTLSLGFYGGVAYVPPSNGGIKVAGLGSGNTVLDAVENAKATARNAEKISSITKWAIPALVVLLAIITLGVFGKKKR